MGALEVAFVVIAGVSLLSAFVLSLLAARVAASPAEDAISAESQRYPITKVEWSRRVDVPFGTVDLPGDHRTFKAQVSGGDKVTAIAVGGHRKGVAAAEVRYAPGSSRSERVQQEGDLAGDLFRELGLEPKYVKMIVSDSDGSFRASLDTSMIGDLDGIRLADYGVYQGTGLRIDVVAEDRRKVMVVSTWPLTSEDPITDRVVRTVRIGG